MSLSFDLGGGGSSKTGVVGILLLFRACIVVGFCGLHTFACSLGGCEAFRVCHTVLCRVSTRRDHGVLYLSLLQAKRIRTPNFSGPYAI